MADRAHISLDNPAFHGRLRQHPVQRSQTHRAVRHTHPRPSARYVKDEVAATRPVVAPPPTPETTTPIDDRTRFRNFPQPNLQPNQATEEKIPLNVTDSRSFAAQPAHRPQRSRVLKRQLVHLSKEGIIALPRKLRDYSRLQQALVGMACFVFLIGLAASIQGFQANHIVAAQVSILSKKPKAPTTTGQAANTTTVPSTTKPTAQTLSQYVVAPNLPRYIKIPKLGVDARVLQVGLTKTGALGTPSNVYDTAWYNGSAEPGQPGTMLIDGHVSSWTAHGVFYGIKSLAPGDMIQIVRGDGAIFNYQVVKTQVYLADDVNMQAAMTPITPGQPGLNLITCTGSVEPGSDLFNERVVVFAQQV